MNSHEEMNQLSRRSMLAGIFSAALSLPSVLALAGTRSLDRKFDSRFEMAIEVEIATQDGWRVHRPYVAVWLEDKDGKSVRTLSLWVQTQRRGPRWIPDLRRWYRDEQNRSQVDGGNMIYTVSSATREAGKYTVIWDGKNDKGKLVDQGEYTLCIEAAREHGTYQLITKKLKVGSSAFKEALPGNIELKGAAVEFRKRK